MLDIQRVFLVCAAFLGALVGWFAGRGEPAPDNLRAALIRGDFLAAHRFHARDRANGIRNSADDYAIGARIARRAELLNEAESLLDEAQRRGANGGAIEFERLLLQAQRGYSARVRSHLKTFAESDSFRAELVWEALGRGYLKAFRVKEAMECFDSLVALRPQLVTGYVGRGETRRLYPKGTWSNPIAESGQDFQLAIVIAPWNVHARRRYEEALLENPRSNEQELREIVARSPGRPDLKTKLIERLHAQGHWDDARALLHGTIARYPSYAPALSEMGANLVQRNQLDPAMEWFERAVKIAPFDRVALYGLMRLTVDPEKSAAYLSRLRKVEEASWQLRDLIVDMVYGRDGVNSNDPALRYRAGLAALKLGEYAEAKLWFERALIEDENFEPARQALRNHLRPRVSD